MKEGSAVESTEVARLRGVERSLIWIRWFGVAFGVFQVWQLSGPDTPSHLVPISYQTVVLLGIGNLLIMQLTRRSKTLADLRLVGYAAFALD
ncbi:MAG: hypothetical protein ACRDKS_11975, partial [Actinomycetota bacterium]